MAPENRIVFDPEICHGKACIRGTRVLVAAIVASIAEGATEQEILAQYPTLTKDDIRAALRYASKLAEEEVLTSNAF